MKTASKIITASIIVLGLSSTIAATPASAGGYYHRSGPDAGAVAGAAIAGMAVGAMVGAMANEPHDDRGYDGHPGYGYGQSRYGYDDYGY